MLEGTSAGGLDARVEILLAAAPTLKPAVDSVTEDVVASAPRLRFEDLQRHWRQRHHKVTAALVSRSRQADGGSVKVELAPTQPTNCVTSQPQQQQQQRDVIVLISPLAEHP